MALTRALRLPPPPHRLADALSHLYADHGAGPPRWGEVRVWATLARWPAWLDEGLVFEVELAPQALPDLGAVTSGALWLTGEGWRARLDLGEAPIRAPETPEIAPCLALTWDTPSRPPQRIDLAGAPWLVRLAALEAALEGRSPQTLRLRLRGAREALEAHLATLAPLGAPRWGVEARLGPEAARRPWPAHEGWTLITEAAWAGLHLRRRLASEGRRRFDIIEARLEAAIDPEGVTAATASQALARRFGVELSGAWRFEGAALALPQGQAWAALRAAAHAAAHAAAARPIDLDAPPQPSPLRRALWAWRGGPAFDGLGELIAWLCARLPGLRRVHGARFSENSFVELRRPAPDGVHWVQIKRSHHPPGFRLAVGVAAYPIYPDDLEPREGEATPGALLPLSALLPERPDPHWMTLNHSDLKRSLADLEVIFAGRVAPFLEAADAALAAYAARRPSGAKHDDG